jgi:Tfp pilus assembly protein PilV
MTLLEVLVALAILTITFVILIRSHIQSVKVMAEGEVVARAALLGESVCARLEATGWQDISSRRGYEPGSPRLSYKTTVAKTAYPGLRKLVIRIFRDREEKKPLLELTRWMNIH